MQYSSSLGREAIHTYLCMYCDCNNPFHDMSPLSRGLLLSTHPVDQANCKHCPLDTHGSRAHLMLSEALAHGPTSMDLD